MDKRLFFSQLLGWLTISVMGSQHKLNADDCPNLSASACKRCWLRALGWRIGFNRRDRQKEKPNHEKVTARSLVGGDCHARFRRPKLPNLDRSQLAPEMGLPQYRMPGRVRQQPRDIPGLRRTKSRRCRALCPWLLFRRERGCGDAVGQGPLLAGPAGASKPPAIKAKLEVPQRALSGRASELRGGDCFHALQFSHSPFLQNHLSARAVVLDAIDGPSGQFSDHFRRFLMQGWRQPFPTTLFLRRAADRPTLVRSTKR